MIEIYQAFVMAFGFIGSLATNAVVLLIGVLLTMPQQIRNFIGATNETDEKTETVHKILVIIGYIVIGIAVVTMISTFFTIFGFGGYRTR